MKLLRTELSTSTIYIFLFFVVLVLAVDVRLNFVGMERMWPDEALYAWCAKRIFENPALIFSKEVLSFHPPLFPVLLAIGHFFTAPETACRAVVFILNVLGIIGVYLLGIRIKSHFVGFFAALVLSFNFLYFNYAFLILTDGALPVMLTAFFLLLANVTPTPPCRKDAFAGLAACAVILLKWPGVLIIPFLVAYYLLAFPELQLRERLRKLAIPLSMTVGVTILLLIDNKILLDHWLPVTTALKGLYLVKPFWYYIKDMPNILIVPFLIPFLIFGLWLVFKGKNRGYWAAGLWLVIYLIAISLTPEKDLRYTLPIFPQLVLICGLGVEEAISRWIKDGRAQFKVQILFLVVTAGFFAWTFQKIPRMMKVVGHEFTGFREAASVIKEETDLGGRALIIAASPRIVRYYTGVNFTEFGGQLMDLPQTPEELEAVVRRSQSPVILVLDRWEKAKNQWFLPLPDDTLAFLEQQLKFKAIKIIDKEHHVGKGRMATDPAIAVFRYDP